MTKTCSKCNKRAVTYIRYSGSHLCRKHFLDFVERRVKKDLKKQGKLPSPSTIGIALSGGKDSTVTLHLLHDIFQSNPHVHLIAITVDEGIKGYRDESIPIARHNCKQLDIEHHLVSFKSVIGKTMDQISKQRGDIGECSYCGVFRRVCLNKVAKKLNVTKLATGHNLDDMAQSILMNFVNSDMQKLARLGPHLKVQRDLVPRMLPLRMIPEKESMEYALLQNLSFHNAECPYSVHALRGEFRDIINNLEYLHPGTRHSIVQSYEDIKDLLLERYPPAKLKKCTRCGEPTSQQMCKTCVLLKKIKTA